MKGYTFQPVLYSRVPHKFQNLPIENLANLSKINDGNLLSKKDLENFFSRQSKPQKPVTLTPFIQRVSFECGFDMSRFSK